MNASARFTAISFLIATTIQVSSWARAPLTFEERVKAQEAIERVYYNHRIWPKENPQPKPPFEEMVPKAVIEAKVTDYLKKCAALDKYWQRPIRPEQLQAEMDRMASMSRDPEMLREFTAVLGNDPFLIAECLARPVLADRLLIGWAGSNPSEIKECQGIQDDRATEESPEPSPRPSAERWWRWASNRLPDDLTCGAEDFAYVPPSVPGSGSADCRPERWDPGIDGAPRSRENGCAVWTGTEMLLWGGEAFPGGAHELWRYNPTIDTWTPSYTEENLPQARQGATAVWTGTEMLVWGGYWDGDEGLCFFGSGAGYDPAKDSWRTLPDEGGEPVARAFHTAVWSGSVMIVWGGMGRSEEGYSNYGDGAMYDPVSDAWTPTFTGSSTPSPRANHTAVWTGSQMLVWGGAATSGDSYNTGAAFSPLTDRWTPLPVTETTPTNRSRHGAVWTGTEMVVWGGTRQYSETNTGGRFDPSSGVWRATSTGDGCPTSRSSPHALWTGSQVLIFGGRNPGGRYDPATDTWAGPIAIPSWTMPYSGDTAVWTGEEMIVCGRGPISNDHFFVRGGRYSPTLDSWLPISSGCGGPETGSYQASVWTGAELVVWCNADPQYGAAYDPGLGAWRPMCSEGAPPRRLDATSVWTGTEMIIWGGYVNTGGRYNPAVDSWAATATGGDCPQARFYHSAVWTGTEMLIWGGRWGGPLDTGARYSPNADRWTPISMGGDCPTARYYHSAVWTGSEMIVWGGSQMVSGNEPDFRTGGRYRPTSDEWMPTSTYGFCPSPRYGHKAVWTDREMIVWGGTGDGSGGMYDPTADRWWPTETGEGCPKLGRGCSAVWTGREMIVWGGSDEDWGGRYVAETGSWYPVPVGVYAPWPPRHKHVGAWTGREMIVWGGFSNWGSYNLPDGGSYCPAPTPFGAGMRYDNGWGSAPLQVPFRASASGGLAPYTFDWDFGDGTPHALEPSPSHTFASEGTYTPTLIARDAAGASVTREGPPITVFPFPCAPEGRASVPTEVYLGVTASFSATVVTPNCIGEALGTWDFGDGATAAGFEATHAYAAPGIYRWTFTVLVEGFSHFSSGLIAVNTTPEWKRGFGFGFASMAPAEGGTFLLQGTVRYGEKNTIGLRWIDGAGRALAGRAIVTTYEPVPARTPLLMNDGGLLVYGVMTYSREPYMILVRLKSDGTVAWSKIYRTGDPTYAYQDPALAELPDGDLMVVARTNRQESLHIAKLSPEGVLRWSKWFGQYPSPDKLSLSDLVVLPSGDTLFSYSDPQIRLVRLTSAGEVVWLKTYGDLQATGTALTLGRDGALLLAGVGGSWAKGYSGNVWVLAVTLDGDILRQRVHEVEAGWGRIRIVPSARGYFVLSYSDIFEIEDAGGEALWASPGGWSSAFNLPDGGLLLHTEAYVAPSEYSTQRLLPDLFTSVACGGLAPRTALSKPTQEEPVSFVHPITEAGGQWFKWLASLEDLPYEPHLTCGWPSCPISAEAEVPTEWSLGDPAPFAARLVLNECEGSPECAWDFGDGATAPGSAVEHAYASPGTFHWSCTVQAGEGAGYKVGTIRIHEAPCSSVCDSTAGPQTGLPPLDVQFFAKYSASGCFTAPVFRWDFGDGATSEERDPIHRYTLPGHYMWNMTATAGGRFCRKDGAVWVFGEGDVLPGDCDGDMAISIGEVQKAINMFLGLIARDCGVDCNGDGSISIGEVQKVINGFLGLATAC